ncbi:MAG: ABC transporter ATP-binding protein [Vicinamibacteria bacterium]|nr:ABC transporter ATP-binding protein [Vicinamibacteria bacterium]
MDFCSEGSADHVITVRDLDKQFRAGFLLLGRVTAIRGVSFSMQSGEVLGYIGPNGSGKTTTIKILMGLLRADHGEIRILGHSHVATAWRRRTGFLPEHPYFYDYLSAREYLAYAGRLCGIPRVELRDRIERLLDTLGLRRSGSVPLRRYSKGMLQRFGVAQALINDPDLLIVDEPMSGLDPLGRRLVRNLIADFKRRGKSVLFSTHILSDAEALCDRIVLLHQGRMIAQGSLDDVLKIDVQRLEVLASGIPAEEIRIAGDLTGLAPSRAAIGGRLRIEVDPADLARLVAEIEARGGRVLSVNPVRKSLEEFFIEEVRDREAKGKWIVDE